MALNKSLIIIKSTNSWTALLFYICLFHKVTNSDYFFIILWNFQQSSGLKRKPDKDIGTDDIPVKTSRGELSIHAIELLDDPLFGLVWIILVVLWGEGSVKRFWRMLNRNFPNQKQIIKLLSKIIGGTA